MSFPQRKFTTENEPKAKVPQKGSVAEKREVEEIWKGYNRHISRRRRNEFNDRWENIIYTVICHLFRYKSGFINFYLYILQKYSKFLCFYIILLLTYKY